VIPKAFWNYYFTINAVSIPASAVLAISGLHWFPIALCTFGPCMGLLAYYAFYRQQYYFYYNLGYTKTRLAFMLFALNTFIAMPLLILILSF